MKSTKTVLVQVTSLALFLLLSACQTRVDELESFSAPAGTRQIASFEGTVFAQTEDTVFRRNDDGWSVDRSARWNGPFVVAELADGPRLCIVSWRLDTRAHPPGLILACREPRGWEEVHEEPEWTHPVTEWNRWVPRDDPSGSYWYRLATQDPYAPEERHLHRYPTSPPPPAIPPELVPEDGQYGPVAVLHERAAVWDETECTDTTRVGGIWHGETVCTDYRREVIVNAMMQGEVTELRMTGSGALWFTGSVTETDGELLILFEETLADDDATRIVRLPIGSPSRSAAGHAVVQQAADSAPD